MKRSVKITEAEWAVMEAVWNKPGSTASEIVSELTRTKSWTANTIRTLLQRLVDKKALESSKATGALSFQPLLSREECVQQESESFIERVFGGAAASMLVHFVKQTELTPQELKELRQILKEKEGR
jgi:BlaI family penicillinase repressor